MAIDEIVAGAQALPSGSNVARGFKGLVLGVAYSLNHAAELGFSARAAIAAGPDYASELDEAASALLAGRSMPRAWLAGFYFNSALVRIAAGSHRALRVMFAPSKDTFTILVDRAVSEGKVVETEIGLLRQVYEDVNHFKHDGKAILLHNRKIETLEQAARAARQLSGLMERAV